MRTVKEIRYSSKFIRSLKSLGSGYKEIVRERELIFKSNCFDQRLKTHKLKGSLKDLWAFSLTYQHRVLFEFITDNVVGFIDIGDHSIYQ